MHIAAARSCCCVANSGLRKREPIPTALLLLHVRTLTVGPCPYSKRGPFLKARQLPLPPKPLQVRILNAGQCSYPSAWKGYSVCTSYDKCAGVCWARCGHAAAGCCRACCQHADCAEPCTPLRSHMKLPALHTMPCRKHWFRVPTSYDEAAGVLSWTHTPAKGNVYYAYFAPYRKGCTPPAQVGSPCARRVQPPLPTPTVAHAPKSLPPLRSYERQPGAGGGMVPRLVLPPELAPSTHPIAWCPGWCCCLSLRPPHTLYPPCSYERHQELVAEMQCCEDVTLEMLVSGMWLAGRLAPLFRC